MFRPDLAVSLGALGQTLHAADCPEDARTAFGEGIAALTPAFDRHPAAFAGLMRNLGADYLRTCEALAEPPDADLLAPVVAIFQRLSPPEE